MPYIFLLSSAPPVDVTNTSISLAVTMTKEQSKVNDSDLDSVTLKAYKVKDCGWNLGSDNCMRCQTFFSCFQCLDWLLQREKMKNFVQKISGKTQNSKFAHFFHNSL